VRLAGGGYFEMFHCWQAVPAVFSSMPVPLAVPQFTGCTFVPLFTFVIVCEVPRATLNSTAC
jgi:hypothetical protein